MRFAAAVHGVDSYSPLPQLSHSSQLAEALADAKLTPATHGYRALSPRGEEKPGPTTMQVRCWPALTLHGISSYCPSPQSTHASHSKPKPVALLHVPIRKLSTVHPKLKQGACSLLPARE